MQSRLPLLATTATGRGEPVILLHGFTGSGVAMAPLSDRLGHWRRIAVDLPGHGRNPTPSEAAAYSVELTAQAVAEFTVRLAEGSCHVVGYSMGGRVALALAVAHPQMCRSLTLISATAGTADEQERTQRRAADAALANQLEQRGLDWFVEHWTALPMWDTLRASLSPTEWQASLDQRRRCNPVGLANSLRFGGTGSMVPLWDQLTTMNVPTLLLCGEADPKFVAIGRHMHHLLPQSELIVLANVGHAAHLEATHDCAQAIHRHLEAADINPIATRTTAHKTANSD